MSMSVIRRKLESAFEFFIFARFLERKGEERRRGEKERRGEERRREERREGDRENKK